MENRTDPRIKAAMQIARQIYALLSKEVSADELDRMTMLSCDIFEINHIEERKNVKLIALGMLEFAAHVEKTSGVESMNKLLAASAKDPQIFEMLNAGSKAALAAMAEQIKASGSRN